METGWIQSVALLPCHQEPPVTLQLILLLLTHALSQYLWMIDHGCWGHCYHNTLWGRIIHLLCSHYNCPCQVSPLVFTQTTIRCVTHSDATFAGSLQSLFASFPSTRDPGEFSHVFPQEFIPCWRSSSHSRGVGGSRV